MSYLHSGYSPTINLSLLCYDLEASTTFLIPIAISPPDLLDVQAENTVLTCSYVLSVTSLLGGQHFWVLISAWMQLVWTQTCSGLPTYSGDGYNRYIVLCEPNPTTSSFIYFPTGLFILVRDLQVIALFYFHNHHLCHHHLSQCYKQF